MRILIYIILALAGPANATTWCPANDYRGHFRRDGFRHEGQVFLSNTTYWDVRVWFEERISTSPYERDFKTVRYWYEDYYGKNSQGPVHTYKSRPGYYTWVTVTGYAHPECYGCTYKCNTSAFASNETAAFSSVGAPGEGMLAAWEPSAFATVEVGESASVTVRARADGDRHVTYRASTYHVGRVKSVWSKSIEGGDDFSVPIEGVEAGSDIVPVVITAIVQ